MYQIFVQEKKTKLLMNRFAFQSFCMMARLFPEQYWGKHLNDIS